MAHDANPSLQTHRLEAILGYNIRRASLALMAKYVPILAKHGLSTVDFSILTLIADNPGVTSRQICQALHLKPPNLVGMIKTYEAKNWLIRVPDPHDLRALGLQLSNKGYLLQKQAMDDQMNYEAHLVQHWSSLTQEEVNLLIQLSKKIYKKASEMMANS